MLHWAIAILAVAVGVLDAGPGSRHMSASVWQDTHPLFALILLALVVSEFYWRGRHRPHAVRLSDLRSFCRRLARVVFLLVYIVIFARMSVAFLGPSGVPAGDLGAHLGGYVAGGAGALLAIRILEGFAYRG